jgi:hypothetical protein
LRQLFLFFLPFLFLWLVLAAYTTRRSLTRVFTAIVLCTTILSLCILPFTIYNYIRFHRLVLLNTNAGYALFWANHPIYGTRFVPVIGAEEADGSYGALVPPELVHLDEAALDQALLKRGVEFLVDDPKRFMLLSLSRIPEYFKFWPQPTSGWISNVTRISSFMLFLPFFLYGLACSWRHLRPSGQNRLFLSLKAPVALLYLFIGVYTLMHLLTWAQIRYRMPVDAILVIFAALGLAQLSDLSIRLYRQKGQNQENNASKHSLAAD